MTGKSIILSGLAATECALRWIASFINKFAMLQYSTFIIYKSCIIC